MQNEKQLPNKVLSVMEIHKTYKARGKANHVLKGINFEVGEGDIVALLGKNGAGKTTLIKCLTGLLDPDVGEVTYITQNSKPSLPGLLLEGDRNFYLRLTVQQNLTYFGVLKGLTKSQLREQIPTILEELELSEKRYTQLKSLSRGMKQKVGLASCLIAEPRLIFLDEPTLGLDVEAKAYLRKKIIELSQRGHALLVSSHELGFIEDIATRVLFMDEGKVREVTEEVFSLSLEQAPIIITLMSPLPADVATILQRVVPTIVQNETTIEVTDIDFKKIIEHIDTRLMHSVKRKSVSLEDLFSKKNKEEVSV
ncbi:MAG: ABC transporter ATP-binding protein [Waterburya sp.]